MKFIFPQNYNFKSKILGWIDYSTAILDIICAILIFGLINIFKIELITKIVIFIILFFPICIFSIVGFNGENIINVINYLAKYIIRPKLLLYKK